MKFNGFSNSIMGASHEKNGLACQDSSAFKLSEHYAVAVVADANSTPKNMTS